MITLTIPEVELFNSQTFEFETYLGGDFTFNHCLASISKWEALWKVPFLTTTLNEHQLLDYYLCMCRTPGLTYEHITDDVTYQLSKYMEDSHTATRIQNDDNSSSGSTQALTSEVIYSLTSAVNVPYECDQWNIHRLMMLLRVISIQQSPKKKMSNHEILKQNHDLNEQRKKQYNTKG